jgi:LPS-assembly lipoprotein
MKRRTWLAGELAVLTLTACGFKLRSSQVFVFDRIAVTPEGGANLVPELIRYLGDRVVPLMPQPAPNAPQVIFDIMQETREKTVVGLNASGQVREFQLRIRVKFRLRNPQGTELIPVTEIEQHRDVSFTEAAALAKEAEEVLLYRDMQADIVQQLLRRLAAVKRLD